METRGAVLAGVCTVVLGGCLAGGEPTEPASTELDRASCEARARRAEAACTAECSTGAARTGRLAGCGGTADAALALVAGDVVGSAQASRSALVLPIDLCLGAAVTSSCADDRAALRRTASRKVDAAAVDRWIASSAPPDCALAKVVRSVECVRDQKAWIQQQSVSADPNASRLAQALWIKVEAFEWSLGIWTGARLECEAATDSECIDDCASGWGDWLPCRWECPGEHGSACDPPGKPAGSRCGEVRYGMSWDSGFTCECSADTAACRAL